MHAKDVLRRAKRLEKEEKERRERESRENGDARGKEKADKRRRMKLAHEREVRPLGFVHKTTPEVSCAEQKGSMARAGRRVFVQRLSNHGSTRFAS